MEACVRRKRTACKATMYPLTYVGDDAEDGQVHTGVDEPRHANVQNGPSGKAKHGFVPRDGTVTLLGGEGLREWVGVRVGGNIGASLVCCHPPSPPHTLFS